MLVFFISKGNLTLKQEHLESQTEASKLDVQKNVLRDDEGQFAPMFSGPAV